MDWAAVLPPKDERREVAASRMRFEPDFSIGSAATKRSVAIAREHNSERFTANHLGHTAEFPTR